MSWNKKFVLIISVWCICIHLNCVYARRQRFLKNLWPWIFCCLWYEYTVLYKQRWIPYLILSNEVKLTKVWTIAIWVLKSATTVKGQRNSRALQPKNSTKSKGFCELPSCLYASHGQFVVYHFVFIISQGGAQALCTHSFLPDLPLELHILV